MFKCICHNVRDGDVDRYHLIGTKCGKCLECPMSKKMKKKFNKTKVGAFLSKVAPGILDIAGDVLPDAGVFGLVKNLIKKLHIPVFV